MKRIVSSVLVALIALLLVGCAPKAAPLETLVAPYSEGMPAYSATDTVANIAACRSTWISCTVQLKLEYGISGYTGPTVSRESVKTAEVLALQQALTTAGRADLAAGITESTVDVEFSAQMRPQGWGRRTYMVVPTTGTPRVRLPKPVVEMSAENPKVDKTKEFEARCRAKAAAGYTLTQRCVAAIQ